MVPGTVGGVANGEELLRLYPQPCGQVKLEGLYLAHRLHEMATGSAPFIYANFLSSLDGRIALEDSAQGMSFIPKHLMTASDFRLFMELHAQAECLITHGGYLRALAEGGVGNILQVRHADMAAWRRANGLKPQPDVVIASASLDFPMPGSLGQHGQKVYIFTGRNAEQGRVAAWQKRGFTVIYAGETAWVHGAALAAALGEIGCRSVYLIAGPQMLDTVLRERRLCRLYLTITHQLMAGKDFRTLLTGAALGDLGNLRLSSLYCQIGSPVGAGQFFTRFETVTNNPGRE